MDLVLILLIIFILFLFIFFVFKNYTNSNINDLKKDNKKDIFDYNFKGIINSRVLTPNESAFFYQLKTIADKYNLFIFPKLRLADIFHTNSIQDFRKITSKHVDFTLCDRNSKPLIFIELDDYTHNYKKNKERDYKKDVIFKSTNTKLHRINSKNINDGLYQIECDIKYLLNKKDASTLL